MNTQGKKILDVTCGARSIWFNKRHPAALYCDNRREEFRNIWKNAGNCTLNIDPDVICSFTDLPFSDSSFHLVVFDPPHLTGAKETAWLVKKYGKLDKNWPKMLRDGFRECMRVLKPDGVLIFKWSEYDIPADEVWKAIGEKPLFGHHSGKRSKTFWACFMKEGEAERHQGWVCTKEALPEHGERVLAVKGSFVGEAYMADNGAWMRHDGFPWSVDAWMRMPEPPWMDEEG